MPLFTLLGGLIGPDLLGLLGGGLTAADVVPAAAATAGLEGTLAPVAADAGLLATAAPAVEAAAGGAAPAALDLGSLGLTDIGGGAAGQGLFDAVGAPGATVLGAPATGATPAVGISAPAFAAPAGVVPGAGAIDPTALAFTDPAASPFAGVAPGQGFGAATPLADAAGGATPFAGATPAAGTPDLAGVGTFTPSAGIGAGGAPTPGQLAVGTAGGGGGFPAAPAAGGGGLSGVGDIVKSLAPYANAASIPLAAGGLAYNIVQGQKQNAATQALATEAAQQGAAGAQLESYLSTGTLPPGLQTSIKQIVAANKAQITQGYANRGMSTDPAQNSALAQDLANADTQGIILTTNIETQLLQPGASMVGIQGQLNTYISQLEEQQQQAIGSSIGNFAQALAGLGQPKTVRLTA